MPEYEMAFGIKTPMFFAMKFKNPEVIKFLLNSGAKLESDEYYDEHYYWPIITGKARIKQLLDEGKSKREEKAIIMKKIALLLTILCASSLYGMKLSSLRH